MFCRIPDWPPNRSHFYGDSADRRGTFAFGDRVVEIEQGLARELRHARVGMAQQRQQRFHPTKLGGVDTDYGKRAWHNWSPRITLRQFSRMFPKPACEIAGIHESRIRGDKSFVNALLKDAEEIFAAAWNGGEDGEMAILVSDQGAIHMLPCSGWDLEPLRIHHGASAAYRIRRSGGMVSLEARSGSESCTLRAERPAAAVRPILIDFPRYAMVH